MKCKMQRNDGCVENLSLELEYAEITWENISSPSESTCMIPSEFVVDKSRFQLKVVFNPLATASE